MNIALFSDTYYPEINGVANSVYQLKKGLESLGHTVYLFTTTSPNYEIEEHEYRIFSIPFVLMKDRRASLPSYFKWLHICKKLNIDIIHTHTEFALGILGMRIAKKLKIKHVHTYHTIYEDYIHYLKLPKNEYTTNFVKKASSFYCNKASVVIAPSNKTKLLLEDYGVTTKINVVPTGIDLEKFENLDYEYIENLKSKFNLTSDDIVFVSIGRISKEKGLDTSISYFNELLKGHSNLKFIVVGDGPYKSELENMVANFGIADNVFFTGYVEWEQIQNYYALGNIFISASTSETQGLTYLEALASGLYLLVQEDECLVGLLEDGVNGKSFNNLEDFKVGYEYLLTKIQNSSDKEINQKYSQLGYANSIHEIYETLLKGDE